MPRRLRRSSWLLRFVQSESRRIRQHDDCSRSFACGRRIDPPQHVHDAGCSAPRGRQEWTGITSRISVPQAESNVDRGRQRELSYPAYSFHLCLVYNTADSQAQQNGEVIRDYLTANGYRVWNEREHARAGIPRLANVMEGIKSSRALAMLVGPDGLRDHDAYIASAAQGHTRLFAVLLPGAEDSVPSSLATSTALDLRQEFNGDELGDSGEERLLAAVRGITLRELRLEPAPRPRPSIRRRAERRDLAPPETAIAETTRDTDADTGGTAGEQVARHVSQGQQQLTFTTALTLTAALVLGATEGAVAKALGVPLAIVIAMLCVRAGKHRGSPRAAVRDRALLLGILAAVALCSAVIVASLADGGGTTTPGSVP